MVFSKIILAFFLLHAIVFKESDFNGGIWPTINNKERGNSYEKASRRRRICSYRLRNVRMRISPYPCWWKQQKNLLQHFLRSVSWQCCPGWWFCCQNQISFYLIERKYRFANADRYFFYLPFPAFFCFFRKNDLYSWKHLLSYEGYQI